MGLGWKWRGRGGGWRQGNRGDSVQQKEDMEDVITPVLITRTLLYLANSAEMQLQETPRH